MVPPWWSLSDIKNLAIFLNAGSLRRLYATPCNSLLMTYIALLDYFVEGFDGRVKVGLPMEARAQRLMSV